LEFRRVLFRSGRRIQPTMAKARRNTGGGVCTKIAAVVPRITITNAAADHSEPSPAPLRMLPPTRAMIARSRPMRLRISMCQVIGGRGRVLEWRDPPRRGGVRVVGPVLKDVARA